MNKDDARTLLALLDYNDRTRILNDLKHNCRFSVDGFSRRIEKANDMLIAQALVNRKKASEHFLSAVIDLVPEEEIKRVIESDSVEGIDVDKKTLVAIAALSVSANGYISENIKSVIEGNAENTETENVVEKDTTSIDGTETELRIENTQLKERIDQLVQEIGRQKNSIKSIRAERDICKKQNSQLEKKLNELRLEHSNEKADSASFRAAKKIEIDELNTVLNEYKEENKRLSELISEMEDEIRRREKQYETEIQRREAQYVMIQKRIANKVLIIAEGKCDLPKHIEAQVFFVLPALINESIDYSQYSHIIAIKSALTYKTSVEMKRVFKSALQIVNNPAELTTYLLSLGDRL